MYVNKGARDNLNMLKVAELKILRVFGENPALRVLTFLQQWPVTCASKLIQS